MGASLRDKATNRAAWWRRSIAAKQAEGNHKGALHEANRWLLEELAKVRRQRPQDAAAVDVALTEKLSELAGAVPFFKPSREG